MSRDWHADPERLGDELAAYALGALGPGEADLLERHLGECEKCREHLLWLRPAIDVLPTSVPQLSPPAGLRRACWPKCEQRRRRGQAPAPGLVADPRQRRVAARDRPRARRRARRRTGGRVPGQRRRPGARRRSGRGGAARRAAGPGLGDARAPRRLGHPARQRLPCLGRDEVYEVWVQREGAVEPASTPSSVSTGPPRRRCRGRSRAPTPSWLPPSPVRAAFSRPRRRSCRHPCRTRRPVIVPRPWRPAADTPAARPMSLLELRAPDLP